MSDFSARQSEYAHSYRVHFVSLPETDHRITMTTIIRASGERVEGSVNDAKDHYDDWDQSQDYVVIPAQLGGEHHQVSWVATGFPFAYPPHSNPSVVNNEKLREKGCLANQSCEGAWTYIMLA